LLTRLKEITLYILTSVSLLRWLGLSGDDEPDPVDSLGEIEKALTDLAPERARYLAGYAYILSRVAGADHVITQEESAVMERLVAERGGLPADQAALVVKIAQAQSQRHRGTEDFIVTREFAGMTTREQRLALLDCLFAVSSSDASIRTVEDNEIRRIASELKLEHADFIKARTAHSRHLQVLRPPSD
jgi:uncharacterized tellurite resistance protein B-like protein